MFFLAFLLKKKHGISTFLPQIRVSTLFLLPKYDWENCFGGISSLDQNSNLNLTPAIWCMNFFFAPFQKKLTKNGYYASCAWVMVIIDMNYQNGNISREYKRIFLILCFHFLPF